LRTRCDGLGQATATEPRTRDRRRRRASANASRAAIDSVECWNLGFETPQGARIKLIQDGDVTASISAAVRGTNDHLAIGIGGTRQAVLSAAALRCFGGGLQAQLWPTSRSEVAAAEEAGVDDLERVFTIEDLAPGEVIVVATGVSNGDLLHGVRFLADSAWTHSLVMCTRCNWVRFVDGIHFFARERREEVRLPRY
jgi:fructose-1,6-bisphosphatase II